MAVYDFAFYARRRDERKAASAVVEVVQHLNTPGSIVQLKVLVNDWFAIQRPRATGT